VSLNELLEKCLTFFAEQAHARNIKIIIDSAEKVTVKANQALVEILLNNLFFNAIKHNIESGEIQVTLKMGSITIRNTGKVESLLPDKLFKRFSKQSSSNSGTGLGLAIIKKIVDTNKWSVKYRLEKNLHTFSVDF
jgi:signal transduction histidine kinase